MPKPTGHKGIALEAWNTWRGRYVPITPKLYRDTNPCMGMQRIREVGSIHGLSEVERALPFALHPNGAVLSPWPMIEYRHLEIANKIQDKNFSAENILGCRARWALLFSDVESYRDELKSLLLKNDSDNKILNARLRDWNKIIRASDMPLFVEDDLRGVNLGGFELAGPRFDGIKLKRVDLSFCELTAANISGASLYEAKVAFSTCFQANLDFSIMHAADFSYSMLTDISLRGSDLSNSKLRDCLALRCKFNGAKLRSTDFSDSQLTGSDFRSLDSRYSEDLLSLDTIVEDITVSESTQLSDSYVDGLVFDKTSLFGKALLGEVIDNKRLSLFKRMWDSILLRPGMFGLGVDLKSLFRRTK